VPMGPEKEAFITVKNSIKLIFRHLAKAGF